MTQTVQPPLTQVRRGNGGPLVSTADLPPRGHFIANEFIADKGGELLDIVNPADESVISQVLFGTAADVDRAVESALAAKSGWARLVPKQRAEILHRIADRVAEHAELLARLEAANTGKPMTVARDDVTQTIDTFRFMAGAARSITSQAAGDYAEGHLSVIVREPLGAIGVVTPWNYPLLMAAWKIAPILAAGNVLVLKPSEQTPLTTLKFAELVADLLPAGVFNVVTGFGQVVGDRLSAHPQLDMIALTGSVNSGKAVARNASATLKRVHLELGGKAPVIVFDDADLAAAASASAPCSADRRCPGPDTSSHRRYSPMCPPAPSAAGRRSSVPSSPSKPSPTRPRPSSAPTPSRTAWPHRCGPRMPGAATTSRRGSTSAPYGSTPTWCLRAKCRGAGSRVPDMDAICPSTPSMTTPVRSTSCTITPVDHGSEPEPVCSQAVSFARVRDQSNSSEEG